MAEGGLNNFVTCLFLPLLPSGLFSSIFLSDRIAQGCQTRESQPPLLPGTHMNKKGRTAASHIFWLFTQLWGPHLFSSSRVSKFSQQLLWTFQRHNPTFSTLSAAHIHLYCSSILLPLSSSLCSFMVPMILKEMCFNCSWLTIRECVNMTWRPQPLTI